MSKNPTIDKETTVLSEDMNKETTPFAEAMEMEPAATALTFAEAMNIELTETDAQAKGNLYKFFLYQNGKHVGYLGQDANGWAKIVPQEYALTLEWYPYNGVNYYRIYGSDRYLSVSDRAYVGFYGWWGATGFTFDGANLRSDYNHQYLSYDSKENNYLTCWNSYTRIEVRTQRL
jgi:hypothetical protein